MESKIQVVQNEVPKSRIFIVRNGRMFENGKDIGSTFDFTLNQGMVYGKDSEKFLGKIDNKEPYVVFINEW